jgi:GntR family transcriptional repressor for pyruvate dehydrogenase complex
MTSSSAPSTGSEPLPTVAALSLSESAARQISEMIRTGQFRSGDRLPPERELAATLGISRGALREAFRTLESVGLLKARVGSGRYVTTASGSSDPGGALGRWMYLQPVSDIIAVRRVLEPAAVLAIPATQVDLTAEECAQSLAKMRAAFSRGDMETAVRHHTRFHLRLVQHAPSQLHRTLLDSMIQSVETAQREIFRTPDAGRHSIERHAEILSALEEGDVEEAARRVAEHLTPAFTYPAEAERPGT